MRWKKAAEQRAQRWAELNEEGKALAREQMKDWAPNETWAFVPIDTKPTVTR